MLFACWNEGSTAVNCGTPRYRLSAGKHASPGTVGRFPSSIKHTCLRRTSAPGWVQDRAREWWSPAHGYPVASTPEAEQTWGRGSSSFSALGAPAGPPTPGLLRDKLADATGYPLPPCSSCSEPTTLVPVRGVSDGAVAAAFQTAARETRSGWSMTATPTTENQDETARQTPYTDCY